MYIFSVLLGDACRNAICLVFIQVFDLWLYQYSYLSELHLMFSLMDKVPNGIEPMLKDLEEHIVSAGLADMVAAAETITTVSVLVFNKITTKKQHFRS